MTTIFIAIFWLLLAATVALAQPLALQGRPISALSAVSVAAWPPVAAPTARAPSRRGSACPTLRPSHSAASHHGSNEQMFGAK
jgi:hypothetical protein